MRMKRLNSLETLMKTRRVQGQNEHNSENHDVSEDILCEIYCFGLHKRLNNSRHRVHWLASKSDRLSLGKVQSRKLPILMQDIFDLYSFVKVYILLHFHCHQIPFMWGIVGNGRKILGKTRIFSQVWSIF